MTRLLVYHVLAVVLGCAFPLHSEGFIYCLARRLVSGQRSPSPSPIPPSSRSYQALFWLSLITGTFYYSKHHCCVFVLHCPGLLPLLHWVPVVGNALRFVESILEKRVVR